MESLCQAMDIGLKAALSTAHASPLLAPSRKANLAVEPKDGPAPRAHLREHIADPIKPAQKGKHSVAFVFESEKRPHHRVHILIPKGAPRQIRFFHLRDAAKPEDDKTPPSWTGM